MDLGCMHYLDINSYVMYVLLQFSLKYIFINYCVLFIRNALRYIKFCIYDVVQIEAQYIFKLLIWLIELTSHQGSILIIF